MGGSCLGGSCLNGSCLGGEAVDPLLLSSFNSEKWRFFSLLTDLLFHNSGGVFCRALIVVVGLVSGTGSGTSVCCVRLSFRGGIGAVGGVVADSESCPLSELIVKLLLSDVIRDTTGDGEYIGEPLAFANAAERALCSAVMPIAFRGIALGSGGNESFEAGIGGRGEYRGVEIVDNAGDCAGAGAGSAASGGKGKTFENLDLPRPGVSGNSIEAMIIT